MRLPLPCSNPFHGSPVLFSSSTPYFSLQGPAQSGSACVFSIIPHHSLPGSSQAELLSIPLMSGLFSHQASAHAVLSAWNTRHPLPSFPSVNSYLASRLSFPFLQKAFTDTTPSQSGLGACTAPSPSPSDTTQSCISANC